MNKKTEHFEHFNAEFQYEAVRALIEGVDTLPALYKILDQNCFSDVWLRMIVGATKELYHSTGLVPNYKEIKLKLSTKCTSEDDLQYISETLDKIHASNEIAPAIIEAELRRFFQERARFLAAQKFVTEQKYDAKAVSTLMKRLEEASDLGFDGSIETEIDENTVLRALMRSSADKIQTFIPGLDALINYGLARGQVGCFMAATGLGKTTFGRTITHNAALNGFRSLMIYFEDSPEDMAAADVAMVVQRKPQLLAGYSEKKAERLVEKYFTYADAEKVKNNKRLCKMLDKKTTVDDIEAKIKDYINRGFRPDLVVIDYFGCLKHNSHYGKQTYEAESESMRQLINIAQKYGMAIWVMGQTNRSGLNANAEPSIEQWQGSIDAAYASAIFLQLVRSGEQKRNGTADLYIHKVRLDNNSNGAATTEQGLILSDIIYDNGLGIIDCSAAAETETSKTLNLIFDDEQGADTRTYNG